ncbi:phosphatidylglycerol lysyltransferase domain-containing protein [Thermoanaerobacterium sp. RBIITD]|uniref:DUF2156 domain-containing protein n=1 Tax=Thermoanaerobacterium sp. RBIITD TaxID=1550240 RepID=UPI001E2AE636|nr:phosphatidylglycerol lysyltransferase domain-containing protein [Thermoanaerobacterium sp. RBIITD]
MFILKSLSLDDKNLFENYFTKYPPLISEYTFTNLYMWNHKYNIKYDIIDDCLCMASDNTIFPPVGPAENILSAFDKFYKMLKSDNNEIYLERFDKDTACKISEIYGIEMLHDEDNFDYVYNTNDLINLFGRKYHSKKNHINKFLKTYGYSIEEISINNVNECLKFTENWISSKGINENSGILSEFEAIKRVFDNYKYFNIKGIVLRIDGKIEAYSFGERLNPDTAVTHIEKANSEVPDAYAFINMSFAKIMSNYNYINREQDLGLPGLRKAKQSYHPIKMIYKFKGKM